MTRRWKVEKVPISGLRFVRLTVSDGPYSVSRLIGPATLAEFKAGGWHGWAAISGDIRNLTAMIEAKP